jgi:hypothetical protein
VFDSLFKNVPNMNILVENNVRQWTFTRNTTSIHSERQGALDIDKFILNYYKKTEIVNFLEFLCESSFVTYWVIQNDCDQVWQLCTKMYVATV